MDTTLSDPLVDRLLDGRYAIEARLARGGMASVYLATDTRLDRRVAVKVMHPGLADDPEFVARFNREARAAARLSHPDIVAVFDQGTDDGHVFLVMEYVAGATLREILRARGRLAPAEALAVMDHVLAALGAAHAAGLVHRDVKPENVLITADGRVKVADFGLARAVAGNTLTGDDGLLLGTASYVAPEQVRDGVADARSDVYSAGIVLFELLTGTPPFTGDAPMSVAYQHINADVPAPSSRVPGIPAEVDALVAAATTRDPAHRPADGRALLANLVEVRDRLGLHGAVPSPPSADTQHLTPFAADPAVEQTTSALPPLPPSGERKTRGRRRRWPYVLAVVLVAAIAAGVGGWWLAVGRYATLPDVIGFSKVDAAKRLHNAGFHVHWTRAVYSTTVAAGDVAAERPKPGHHVKSGSTITLALSKGPETHQVPNVSGDSVDQAKSALHDARLGYAGMIRRYDDSVSAGQVIQTKPRIGTVQRAGTPITLIVSDGPAPVQVPDVVGKPFDQAKTILEALGFSVTRTDAFDDKVHAGDVVSSNPPGGTTSQHGATVTLVVSKGPHLYPVPNVQGKSINDAIKIIEQAGFKADAKQIFPGGPGKVVRETPTGMQPKGTVIELDYF